MATAWYICGYKVHPVRLNLRICTMDNFTAQISQDAGEWAESECLGDAAVVKVRASHATLATIAGTTGFDRIPWDWLLQDTMVDLSNAQYNVVRGRVRQMGYSDAEIDAGLGANVTAWRTKTFIDLLNFICQRRIVPRFDRILQQIIFDGEAVACKSPAEIDAKVR